MDYFYNFIKYINNKNVLNFNKKAFINKNSYKEIAFNYFKNNKPQDILLSQNLNQFNYITELLKKHLGLISFEKSFYKVNLKKSMDELELNNIFKKHDKKNLKYYDADFIIGEIPDDICQKINDVSTKIDNLKIRGINSYFNSLYDYSVIPCYKEKENKCQENNEFD